MVQIFDNVVGSIKEDGGVCVAGAEEGPLESVPKISALVLHLSMMQVQLQDTDLSQALRIEASPPGISFPGKGDCNPSFVAVPPIQYSPEFVRRAILQHSSHACLSKG